MSIELLFWVIMLADLILSLYNKRTAPLVWAGNDLVIWVLLAFLGWTVFGPAIHR